MRNERPPVIDATAHEEGGRVVYEAEDLGPPPTGWKRKLQLWSMVVAGVAVGVVFFLAFLTVLIYVVLPLTLIGLVWWWLRRLLGPPPPAQ